jgi:hypothetical protein
MFKSLSTKIEGHSGVEISYTSDEAFQLLSEGKYANLEQCAFLLSFLNISPESAEWQVVSDILSNLDLPEDIVSDFLFTDNLQLCAVPVKVDYTKTHEEEALHCEAANIHFEKGELTFEEMLLQQNLRVYYYIVSENGVLAAQIMLYGIITLMPLQPIITLNNAVLLPGVLYPLKLTREIAKDIHIFAMQRFIFNRKEEIIQTITKEVQDILGGNKLKPELSNALGKMVSDYTWNSKLAPALASLARELNNWIQNIRNKDDIEAKIQRILGEIVDRVQRYKDTDYPINFDSLLLKPGRRVRSNSRKTQDLAPAK